MIAKIESAINILPVFLVSFTAVLDLTVALGLALGFSAALTVYEIARRGGWGETAAGVIFETDDGRL